MQQSTFETNRDSGERELSLGDLFRGLWRARAWAIGGFVLALAVAAALLMLNHFLRVASTTYSQEIAFRIGGQSAAEYPNGTSFSSNDLRSPVVLSRVFEETQLEQFGLTYQNFVTAVTVTPSSAIYEGVVERYRTRLADDSLTFEERRQIEAEFSAAISSSISSGATVNFNTVGTAIPANVGLAVVAAIPNVWADIYINQLGVLDLPFAQSSNDLVDPQFLQSLDYPAAYDVLEASFSTVRTRINDITQIAGSETLSGGDNAQTLLDVEREVDRLQRFSLEQVLAPLTELGLNKSPELTGATYQYRVDELDREIRLANENARIVTEALQTSPTSADPTPSQEMAVENRQLPGAVVQQFGPELVDRLIGMSVENAGIGFRENLIQTKLAFEQTAVELTAEREKIIRRLALIQGQRSIPNEAALEETFVSEADSLAQSLNRQWDAVNSILGQINLARLNFDKQLFQPLPTVDPVSEAGALTTRTLIVTLGMAAFLGLVGGLLVAFVLSMTRQNRAGERTSLHRAQIERAA